MSIFQLGHRCWELDFPGSEDDKQHFDSEAAAVAAVKAAVESHPGCEVSARQRDTACWLVRCDGDCDALIDEEDEGYVHHYLSRHAAEVSACDWHWVLVPDETSPATMCAYCPGDVPPRDGPQPVVVVSAAEMKAAGQEPLPGTGP